MEIEEFNALVMPHRGMIFRLAISILVARGDAEDAVQEVLAGLWRRRGSLNRYDNMGAVIYTATRHHCIDVLRKRRRTGGVMADREDPGAHGHDMAAEVERSDMAAIVKRLIARLPSKQSAVIHLRDVEGFDFDEIARMTDMKPETVRVTLSRARKTVAEQFKRIMDHGTEKH